ncbi:thiamine phosphate synthase [Joostella sp. CR20]|uniref:thiamine phosphate synthase n=1 Tax=Joostella sp. CR20 TaxID=2804312 RepID=UPI00313DB110
MKISRIQYISQGLTPQQHLQNIQKVCENGGQWIQLRIKNETSEEILKAAVQAKEICKQFNAKLIINDHPKIAKMVNADGVHLGKEDMCPTEAQKILGNEKIIGGTANTIHDVKTLIEKGVDYIGLGPFRHTSTKANLSPILGIEGYKTIISQLNEQERKTPIIAIGGIVLNDVEALNSVGIYGVAMSKYLTSEDRINEKLTAISTIFNQKKKRYEPTR